VCLAHRVPGDGRNSGGSLESRPLDPSLESAAGSLHWTGHARAALGSFMTSAPVHLSWVPVPSGPSRMVGVTNYGRRPTPRPNIASGRVPTPYSRWPEPHLSTVIASLRGRPTRVSRVSRKPNGIRHMVCAAHAGRDHRRLGIGLWDGICGR